jgi:hypothetical protein
MEMTIITHNTQTAKARIRFEHNDITVEQDFDLWSIVPGTRFVFPGMGLDFDEVAQEKVIQRLKTMITEQIESGAIQNPPQAPEAQPEPEAEPTQ